MIDLVLVKKDMVHYMQDVRTVRVMGGCFSDHHTALYKIRWKGEWIKGKDMVNVARMIRGEKLREHQYIEGNTRCLESKNVE